MDCAMKSTLESWVVRAELYRASGIRCRSGGNGNPRDRGTTIAGSDAQGHFAGSRGLSCNWLAWPQYIEPHDTMCRKFSLFTTLGTTHSRQNCPSRCCI